MEKTSAPTDLRAIIVSIDLRRSNQNDLEQFNSSEFIELARSSGLKVEHHLFSKQNFVSASHFLTKGKADELKDIVESENIKLVVLDCELSPSQERNLEKLLCARVLDRTGLILDILNITYPVGTAHSVAPVRSRNREVTPRLTCHRRLSATEQIVVKTCCSKRAAVCESCACATFERLLPCNSGRFSASWEFSGGLVFLPAAFRHIL